MKYRYNVNTGIQKIRTKTTIALTVSGLVIGGTSGLSIAALGAADAAPSTSGVNLTTYTSVPFTNGDLTSVDRIAPSGGDSLLSSFSGHSNVLELGVDNSKQSSDSFYDYEGLQLPLNSSPTALRADLYLDNSWTTNSVGVGLWGVGQDQSGNITAYPIIEFVSHDASDAGYTGWRVFNDNVGGWINEPAAGYNLGTWNTISMVLNPSTTLFNFYVNGVPAGSNTATGSSKLSAVIFDNYNYGTTGNSYTVDWSNLETGTTTAGKDACMKGGWNTLTTASGASFKNQGDCVSYVATGGKN